MQQHISKSISETATHATQLAANSNKLQPCLPTEHESKPFLDESDLLARLPVCRRTVHNWIKAGKLPVVKIGRRKLFHWPTVEAALLRQQRNDSELNYQQPAGHFFKP